MNAFDKIFMMSIIYNTSIEMLEETLEIPDIYNTYCVERRVNLNELEKIALFFNVPMSFFFVEGEDLKLEVEKWVRLMTLRVNKCIGNWDDKAMDVEWNEIEFPPTDDFVHEFTYYTSSDFKLLFIVEGVKMLDKFSLSYTLGYQFENEEMRVFPITDNMETLYKELLIYIDEEDFFEEYCEE